MDGFRYKYIQNCDILNDNPYTGMCYEFNKTNTPNNEDSNNNWLYASEFSTVQNLIDIHSMIITCQGSLSVVKNNIIRKIIIIH